MANDGNQWKNWLESLVIGKNSLTQVINEFWRSVPLDVDSPRLEESPVKIFYKSGEIVCGTKPAKLYEAPAAISSSNTTTVTGFLVEQFATQILHAIPDNADIVKIKLEIDALLTKRPEFKTDEDVVHLIQALEVADNPRQLLSNNATQRAAFSSIFKVAKDFTQMLNARNEADPTDSDWKTLGEHIDKELGHCVPNPSTGAGTSTGAIAAQLVSPCRGTFCSLIYCYWLDEAGLPWSLERLADRIENGLNNTNKPLSSVRVREDSHVSSVINRYTSIWQQGHLAAVDERRRQYLALYGYPLHIAARWGRLETIDPRANFPAAFNGFIIEAMRYYYNRQDLDRIPDPLAAMSALDKLGYFLKEGNENLRTLRTPEIRGQVEYTKQVLGGYLEPPPLGVPSPNYVDVGKDWLDHLPGRPGIKDSMDPWEFVVEMVATLYGWKRPRIEEYVTLAETSELLLILVRLITSGNLVISEGIGRAILSMLKDPIYEYVNAYKTVARVDLGAQPFMGPPAEAMARFIQAPLLPPYKRRLAGEMPLSA